MSDSEDSTVTYTEVSSPFEGLSDIGSSRVDGLPMMPEDPYAYVVAAFHALPSPDYVSEDDVLPAKDQPLPVAASPTAQSPDYVLEFDLEEDPEEDEEDPKEDPADYPTDRDDDDEEGEEEPSRDDADDEKDEEEEHPAPVDSVLPPPVHRVTARMSIRPQMSAPFLTKEDAKRFLAIPTPPPLPLTPLSSPLPWIRSPPLLVSPPLPLAPLPLPVSPTYPLDYRATMIRLRVESPSTSLSPPPHIILSHTRVDIPPSGAPPSGTPPLLPI
ncbi:hypothetical protein Tco_1555363 [Tanacetum coccineum]